MCIERARGIDSGSRSRSRHGRFDEALALIPLVPRSLSAGATLEALCEIAAARERWDEAARLVEAAREEAEVGEQLALRLFADRLEGRAASAAGDADEGGGALARTAEGFAAIGARWEEAWSRLSLAEVVVGSETQHAERELAAALPVFEELGSVREAERARALLAKVAVRCSPRGAVSGAAPRGRGDFSTRYLQSMLRSSCWTITSSPSNVMWAIS